MTMKQLNWGAGWLPDFLLSAVAAAFFSALPLSAQQFTEIATPFPAYPQPCVAWGDSDGDGRIDVLIAGMGKRDTPTTTIYRNTPGGFVDSGLVLPGLSRASAAWGDFNNDGRLDLALTGLNSAGVPATLVYRNNGTNFTPVAGNFTAVFAGSVAWGDYDGDGRLDLLVTGITSPSQNGVAVTRLYHNDGNGVFTSVPHPFPDCYVGAVAWGDYNKDGKLDVVIAGSMSGGGLVANLWRNEGGGQFTDAGANLPGTDLGFVAWGDYDNDGDLDLLFGGNSNEGWIARIYRNDGGSFTNINAGLLGVIWSSAAWGDYNNDGKLDAMIMGYDPVAQVPVSRLYRNLGGDQFADSGQTFHNLYLGTLSWVDYDNDGNLDLVQAGNSGGFDLLNLYRNNNAVTNTVPTPPSGLSATNFGPMAWLTWSPASDAQTPASGLSYNLRVGTTPGGADVLHPASLSNGFRQIVALGNPGARLSAQVNNLLPNTTYYWSVQALDSAFAGGPFAAEGSFRIPQPAPPELLTIRREAIGFSVEGMGTPGWTYGVLTGTTLGAGSWSRIGSAPADVSGRIVFTDTNTSFSQRFYRGVFP
jgi:hypothetical protein